MIRQMTVNLALFCLIILVFMFAFGVCVQSLMFPNQPLNRLLLVNIFFPSFFVIGGEYSTNLPMMVSTTPASKYLLWFYFSKYKILYVTYLINNIKARPCTSNPNADVDNLQSCPDYIGTQVGLAVYVIYLLLIYILLITLLIAIFR